MAKKVTSIVMIVSLSLSMIFGGLGLSLHFASGSPAASGEYVTIGHIKNLITLYGDTNAEAINQFIDDNYNTGYILMTFAVNPYNPFIFQLSLVCPMSSTSHFEYFMISGGSLIVQNDNSSHPNLKHFYCYNLTNSGFGYHTRIGWYTTSYSSLAGVESLSSNGPIVPGTYADNTESYIYYTNRDIYNSNGIIVHERNILDTDPEPEYIYYSLYVFWVGERRYLTIVDQSLIRQLYGNDLMEYVLFVTYDNDADSDFEEAAYTFLDCTLLQYTGIESNLENVSPRGVYAIDITDKDWLRISGSEIEDITEEFDVIGLADNIPLILNEAAPEPGTNGTPDSYSNSWSTFITYINNYDTTQIIPENLVDTIFGVNGFKLYPVDVSLPSSTISSNNPVTTDIHTYKYHFSSLPADIGLNYDLMDVCIIPKSITGNYGLVFFYDDTLAAANKFVDYVDYKDLLEQFDLIIVIDDTLEALQENAWWEFIVPNDVWSHVDYMAVSGSSSLGIQYTSDPLPGNIESGFCIVTKRAIQRQQLYLFNDGITKSYKLMSDFVEKHGLWENSFFEWSQSIFYTLQTIGGKTNDIYNLLVGLNLGDVLDNISRQLERIAVNTSEEDPGYWFLSLFNFVSRFSVSDLDFANWVENYDDFESQIPLPNEDVTPIPIPTITSEVG